MIEFETMIKARGAPNGAKIQAWKRAADSPLCCHPEYISGTNGTSWTITHIATGLNVNPSRVPDEHAAERLLAVYETLPGWNTPSKELADKVETAYDEFWEVLP